MKKTPTKSSSKKTPAGERKAGSAVQLAKKLASAEPPKSATTLAYSETTTADIKDAIKKASKKIAAKKTETKPTDDSREKFLASFPAEFTKNAEIKKTLTASLGISESVYGRLKKSLLAEKLIERKENSYRRVAK